MTDKTRLKQKAVEAALKSGLTIDDAVAKAGWTRSAYYSSRYNRKRAKGKKAKRRAKVIDLPELSAIDDLPDYYFAIITNKKGVMELARGFL